MAFFLKENSIHIQQKVNTNEESSGNTVQFDEIYKQYWRKLYIYAFRILHDQQVCEDLIQEVFLSLWKKKNDIVLQSVSSYLFQSLRFQIFKYYRDNKFSNLDIEKFQGILKSNPTEQMLDLKDTKKLVNAYLDTLPNRCREIFYMSRFENLSHKEISDELGISSQTVKNQITTAVKLLRTHYKELTLLILFFI